MKTTSLPNTARQLRWEAAVIHWSLNCLLPHVTVAVLGSVGTVAFQQPSLKLVAFFSAVAAVFALLLRRYVLALLRRLWRLAMGFHLRTCRHHQFLFAARKMVLQLLAPAYCYTQPSLRGRSMANQILAGLKADVITMMESMVGLFENLAPPGTKVWMSLRELRNDDRYHTFARAGRFNPDREHGSVPLHRTQSATMRRLRASLDAQQSVLLTGSAKGPELWTPQPNDSLGEDKCVLMGGTVLHSWDPVAGPTCPKLVWIVTVCADRENAFDASHIPFMQSCVDVFSIIANVLARTPGDGPRRKDADICTSRKHNDTASNGSDRDGGGGNDNWSFSI